MSERRDPHYDDHHGHDKPDIEIVSSSSDDSDDSRGRRPRYLEAAPKHRSRSRGRKDKKKNKYKKRRSSLFSDDSSSEDDFVQGFRAGRNASLRRTPLSRLGRSRSRSRSRFSDYSDDSFSDLEPPRRYRSKSRSGRRR